MLRAALRGRLSASCTLASSGPKASRGLAPGLRHHQPSSTPQPSRILLKPLVSRPSSRQIATFAAPSIAEAVEMEVTRHNFEEALPRVREALARCHFYSLDCEMTGLFMSDQSGNYLDEIEDRYLEMIESSQGFIISQFGLSAFAWEDGQYKASTFNFWLFPRPWEGWDRRFVCQASSLDFLARCNFDFNKFIHDGISYMPVSMRDAKLSALERQRERPDILIKKPEDVELVCRLVSSVTAWLQTDDETLLLESGNSYQRAIQYQELRKDQFGAAAPPGFFVERTETEEGRPALQLRRATPEEVAAFEEEQREQRIRSIHDAAGFSTVLEAMRDSGKPAVGHNLAFDLAYSLASYAGPLPPSWEQYKQMVGRWFPGGVYDTKHLARQLPDLFEDTTLGLLHDGLLKGQLQEQVSAFLAQQTSAAAAGAAEGRSPLQKKGLAEDSGWDLPGVAHAPGFERYVGAETERYAHEAGYDAYMTGAVFACLVRLFEAQAAGLSGGSAPTGEQQPSLDAVQERCWRMNLSRTDLPYAALQGPDPPLDRSHVLYLTGWTQDRQPRHGGDIARRLADSNVGEVRASMVEGGQGALLEFANPECIPIATDVLLKKIPGCSVSPYTVYSDKRRQQREAAAAAAAEAAQQRNGNGKRPRREAPAQQQQKAAEEGGGKSTWCSVM